MRKAPFLALAAVLAATLTAACGAPTAPQAAAPASARHDDPPPPVPDTMCKGGGLIGSGTRC